MLDDDTPVGGSTCATSQPLAGHAVGVTGDRRAEELVAHLRARGAVVLEGPMLHTRPITDDAAELRAHTEAIIRRPPAFLIVTTGIGMRSWVNAAASWDLDGRLRAALAETRVLARGPKAVGAVSEAGLRPWFVEPTGRTSGLVDHLVAQGVDSVDVVLQLPGAEAPEAVARIIGAGARLTCLTVYDWTRPDDLGRARRLLRAVAERRVSAVTFTSRPAVRNFVEIAAEEGVATQVLAALARRVLPVCVGPSTAEDVWARTGARPYVAAQSTLGGLVHVVAEEVHRRGHHHVRTSGGTDVIVQRRLVRAGDVTVSLSDREADLLGGLLARSGRTLGRDHLVRVIWHGDAVEPSVVETTVGRLRRRLAPTGVGILTVTGRGYRLDGQVVPCPDMPPGHPPALVVASA